MTEMLKYIGRTPLINLDGIWVKCEQFNPTGSIKDRIAYEMLKYIPRNKRIVEISSGNTGISIAYVGSLLGFNKIIIIVPKKTSIIKRQLISKYGADLIHVDSLDKGIILAEEMSKNDTVYWTNQFDNAANKSAQEKMASEVAYPLNRFDIKPDAVVVGIGTGGTLAGLYAVFPQSVFYTFECTNGHIEGVSDGVPLPLKPRQCTLNIIPVDIIGVLLTQKFLLNHYGFDVGLSSAANFLVATQIKEKFGYKNILIIFHDNGMRYIQ